MKYLMVFLSALGLAGVGYWLLLRGKDAAPVASGSVGSSLPSAAGGGPGATKLSPVNPAPGLPDNWQQLVSQIPGINNQQIAALAAQAGGVNLADVAKAIQAAGVPSIVQALNPTGGTSQNIATAGKASTPQAQQILGQGVGTTPNNYTGGLSANGASYNSGLTKSVDKGSVDWIPIEPAPSNAAILAGTSTPDTTTLGDDGNPIFDGPAYASTDGPDSIGSKAWIDAGGWGAADSGYGGYQVSDPDAGAPPAWIGEQLGWDGYPVDYTNPDTQAGDGS